MNKLKIAVAVLAGALAYTAAADDTNTLCTAIGTFEARPDVIIVKGFGNMGSVALDVGTLSLRCKETLDVGTGTKMYGLMFELEDAQAPSRRSLVDDDEVDSLLSAVDYLMKIKDSVTSLPGYEGIFTTKAGLRVIAHSDHKEGGALTYLQFCDAPRVQLSPVQMMQFYNLLSQAKKSLDALKSEK